MYPLPAAHPRRFTTAVIEQHHWTADDDAAVQRKRPPVYPLQRAAPTASIALKNTSMFS